MSNWSENNLELWCKMVLDVLTGISGKMEKPNNESYVGKKPDATSQWPNVKIKKDEYGDTILEFDRRTMVKFDNYYKVVDAGNTLKIKGEPKKYAWPTSDVEMNGHLSSIMRMAQEYVDFKRKNNDPMLKGEKDAE
jgi:hypothetical protein